MPVALDKMQGTSGSKSDSQPALHPSRMEKMLFVRYSSPPGDMEDRAEYDAWLERVNYLSDDLHWLLQLPHDKFWCQAVFDESLHKALDSFLRHCPRSYDELSHLPEIGQQRQVELCRLVFMTYLRMSTHKESKDHFITPEVFGEILYQNFLFDIPKILDICALFGKANGPLVSKMVGNIFTQQPKYMDDLRETVPTILQVFSNIAAKCGIHPESAGLIPAKLVDKSERPPQGPPGVLKLSVSDFEDILLYLSDTAATLHRFLDVYPGACPVLHGFTFNSVITNFYECVIPALTTHLKQLEFPNVSLKKKLSNKLHCTKRSLLAIFHSIVQHTCLQPILENGSKDELVTSCIEDFLHTMTAALGERRFLADYESVYNFQDDVDLLLQASSTIDASQFDYIQSAINSAYATFGHRKSPRGNTNTGGRTSPDGAADASGTQGSRVDASVMGGARASASGGGSIDQWGGARPKTSKGAGLPDDFQTEDYGEGAVSFPRPGEVEVESLITSIKDLFPHLGEGFIELVLEELSWDQEKVVSSILEEKLPPSLQDISQDLPRQEREREVNQGDGQTDHQDMLTTRRNVFDYDEFDVFKNRGVDLSRAHIGKRDAEVDLEDKSTIQAVRATYDAYGSRDQDSMYDNKQMYEDEYDDTYDTNAIGADDADSADELNSNKVLPRVLMELEKKKAKAEGKSVSDNDDEEDNDDNAQPSWRTRDEFVADPAKLREQAEQRRRSQASARGGKRGRGGGPPPHRDVVGAAKGQGQSSDVQHNRRVKEKFKGQRNRNMADKKMSKGMF